MTNHAESFASKCTDGSRDGHAEKRRGARAEAQNLRRRWGSHRGECFATSPLSLWSLEQIRCKAKQLCSITPLCTEQKMTWTSSEPINSCSPFVRRPPPTAPIAPIMRALSLRDSHPPLITLLSGLLSIMSVQPPPPIRMAPTLIATVSSTRFTSCPKTQYSQARTAHPPLNEWMDGWMLASS